MTDDKKHTVEFHSQGDSLVGRVRKDGLDKDLLKIEMNALNVGREGVGGLAPEHTQASLVGVIALTWAT